MTPLEAMQSALDALRDLCDDQREQFDDLARPISTAIEEMEKAEPVAWYLPKNKRWQTYGSWVHLGQDKPPIHTGWEPIYTFPVSHEGWQGDMVVVTPEEFERFALAMYRLGAEDMRERAAEICDEMAKRNFPWGSENSDIYHGQADWAELCAAKIRNQGDK